MDMQPWHPMSDPVDQKHIGKLGEEAGELAAAACRAQIQGIDGINPKDGRTNKEHLEDEIADVLANSRLCIEQFGLHAGRIMSRACEKEEQLRNWHRMA